MEWRARRGSRDGDGRSLAGRHHRQAHRPEGRRREGIEAGAALGAGGSTAVCILEGDLSRPTQSPSDRGPCQDLR